MLITYITLYYTHITVVLREVPEHLDLLNLLANIEHKWYEVGSSLGVQTSVLNGLSQSNKTNMVRLAEVLTSWRDTTSSPVTWENIIRSMEGPIVGQHSTAVTIHEYLTKPEVYSKYQYNMN